MPAAGGHRLPESGLVLLTGALQHSHLGSRCACHFCSYLLPLFTPSSVKSDTAHKPAVVLRSDFSTFFRKATKDALLETKNGFVDCFVGLSSAVNAASRDRARRAPADQRPEADGNPDLDRRVPRGLPGQIPGCDPEHVGRAGSARQMDDARVSNADLPESLRHRHRAIP